MTSDETAIANLVYLYARYVDDGELERAAALLSGARIKWYPATGGEFLDATRLLEYWRRVVVLYDDGTPQTKHLLTNLIIMVDDDGERASCSSDYTVLQAGPAGMNVILAGRYFDEFERSGDGWRYSFREYGPSSFVGDVSRHRRS